jgi:hypothetical protein
MKKFNGTDRKRIEEQKSPLELGKIVDLPLITSANMISVMRKENPIAAANVGNMIETTTQRYPATYKTDKKSTANVPLNDASTVKKSELESSSKIVPQFASSNNIGDSDCAKHAPARISECLKHKDEKIEIVSASLKNDEESERDRAVSASDRNVNSADDDKTLSRRTCEVEEECEGAAERKFCFENSRELAGEPDGKADEEEISEPPAPALPASPPPITEPRPSFLHGSVNADAKSKPIVPQKPMTFSAKTSLNGDTSLTTRKISNGDYVLPPPSVANVAGKSVQNSGEYQIAFRNIKI